MHHTCRSSCRVPFTVLLLASFSLASCGEDPVDPGPFADLDFSGTWNPASNFGGPFGHDGNPVVSENFIVFSGTASQAARQYASDVAEESLGEVLDYLGITTEAFTFLPTYSEPKIHIMAIKDQDFGNNTGFAYRDGMVTISREARQYTQFSFDEAKYKRLMKHEGTHVVEFLLIGNPQRQQASDVWWREGFAHYMSRPRPSMITTREGVEAWQASHTNVPDGGNPIAVHVWSDFPQSVRDAGQTGSYYDMFELTVRYLLDPDGHGATPDDVVALYDAMGNGFSFGGAMLAHFGIDTRALEDDYWNIMLDYLDRITP